MLRLGHLDDVDMAMMIHATPRQEEGKPAVPMSNNGCVVKTVRYLGRASHAGGAPHMGINALYAAPDIRVHPIITHGGSQVALRRRAGLRREAYSLWALLGALSPARP